jgi:hypothetical protein
MKPNLLAIALTLCLTSPVWAQDDSSGSTSGSSSSTPPHHHWEGGPGGANLTADERTELKTAHDAAIQANPDLKTQGEQLRQQMMDFEKKMHDAMVAADPKVAPILAKMHHHHGPPPGDGGSDGGTE